MEQLHEFGMFLCVWTMVMLVVAVAGKRIAQWLRSMGVWPSAIGRQPGALPAARMLRVRPSQEIRG